VRRAGFALAALLGAGCGHARHVEEPTTNTEPPHDEARAEAAPRAPRKTVTENDVSLATSPAGLLKPGAAKAIAQKLSEQDELRGEPGDALDARTREALRRFQKHHGLPATGSPDDATVRKLGLEPRDVFVSGPRP
jgi:peptidoglycan hydrolase-like protein with peptidoglycan-binding domain